jgi:hypothetical protein
MAQPPLSYQLKVAKTIVLAELITQPAEGHPLADFQIKELLKSAPDSPWQVNSHIQVNIKMFGLLGRPIKTGQQAMLFFLAHTEEPFEMLLNENHQFKYGQDDPTIASNLNLAEIKKLLKR